MPITKNADLMGPVQDDSAGIFDDEPLPVETIEPAPEMAEPEPEVPVVPVTEEALLPEPDNAQTAMVIPEEATPAPAPALRKSKQSSAKGEVVNVGLVEGQLLRLPLADVMGSLLEELRLRIVELSQDSTNGPLESWMRDTEGRCAPAFFTVEDGVASFFYGSQELAAALRLGFTDVFVIHVANSDSGAVQQYLQTAMLKRRPKEDEDDLIFRAAAFYDM